MMNETILRIAKEQDLVCIKSCCGVHMKTCRGDVWKGDIASFARAIAKQQELDMGWQTLTDNTMPEEGSYVLCQVPEHPIFPIVGYFVYDDQGKDEWKDMDVNIISRPLKWARIPKT